VVPAKASAGTPSTGRERRRLKEIAGRVRAGTLLAPVPPAAGACASRLLPNLPKLVLQSVLLPRRSVVDMPANFVCLASQAPALFVAFLLRIPTGRTTWWGSGRPRPPLHRDNPWLRRRGRVERVRDPKRHGGDDERAGQQQRTDILADHGVFRSS
jgi:hypothetical protein